MIPVTVGSKKLLSNLAFLVAHASLIGVLETTNLGHQTNPTFLFRKVTGSLFNSLYVPAGLLVVFENGPYS